MSKQLSNIKAFTLLEALIALLVISGSLLVYQGLTRTLLKHSHYLARHDQDNWLLFSHQLREELSGARFYKVADNKLYVEKGKKVLAFTNLKVMIFENQLVMEKGINPCYLEYHVVIFT